MIQKVLSCQPIDDFAPISRCIVNTGGFLVGRSTLPISTPRALFAYARANPGKRVFASAGVGSITHRGVELIKKQTGTDSLHAPFSNPSAAMTAVIASDADITTGGSVTTVLPFVQGRRVRRVARLGAQRAAVSSCVSTLTEGTVPGLVLPCWRLTLLSRRRPRWPTLKPCQARPRCCARQLPVTLRCSAKSRSTKNITAAS